MKQLLTILLALGLYNSLLATTQLHNNQCGDLVAFHEKILPASSAHNYYWINVYDDNNSLLIDYGPFTYANRPRFIDIDPNGNLDFDEEYSVEIGISTTTSNPTYGSSCTIEFENQLKLHNNYCDNLTEQMHRMMYPKFLVYYEYQVYIFDDDDLSTQHQVGTAYSFYPSDIATYLDFCASSADLEYNKNYWVAFKTKNLSTSDWSPLGPACEVKFSNQVKLHSSRCDIIDQSMNSDFRPNIGGFYDYEARVYQNGVFLTAASVKLGAGQWMDYKDFPIGLRCGSYDVKFRVKNISSSPWSPEGPSCKISLDIPDIIFVDKDATGANNGMTWGNAYTCLESALDPDNYCDEMQIWIAEGTYRPNDLSSSTSREERFEILDGMELYGGFDATESASFDLNNRDIFSNLVTLSGDLDSDGSNDDDNAYHVVYINDGVSDVVLDGLTITMGRANYNDGIGSTGTDKFRGGGIYAYTSDIEINNCVLKKNYAVTEGGGAYLYGGTTNFTNCIIADNGTGGDGGGVLQDATTVTYLNCTFNGNYADGSYGSIADANGSNSTIDNSIIWSNGSGNSIESVSVTMANGIYDGASPGGANISNTSPLFNSDLSLGTGSPAIDPSNVANNPTLIDAHGNSRTQGNNVDWGALETESSIPFDDINGIERAKDLKSKIYPNPATHRLTILNTTNNYEHWEVLDLAGKVIESGQMAGPSLTLDVGHMKIGIYMVKLSGNKGDEFLEFMVK